MTDAARWQRVVIDSPPGYENRTVDLVTVQSMSGTLSSFDGTFDLQHNTLELAKVSSDSTWRAHFALTRPQTDEVVLDGTYDTHRLHVKLRLTHPRFTLTAARFHWPESAWVDPFNP